MTGPLGGNNYGNGPLKPPTGPLSNSSKTIANNLESAAKAIKATDNLALNGSSKEVAQLQEAIKAFVPGIKFTESGSKWTESELKQLKDLVTRMSPGDLEKLKGTEFIKGDKARGEADVEKGEEAGFATLRENGTKAIYLFDTAYKSNNLGAQAAGPVLAHEVGHLMQTFSREDIFEFAKLGWVGQDGTKNFTNWGGSATNADKPFANLKPDGGKSVSDRAKASPQEDYAESFRLYMQDPQALLKASPERFLFLNGKSQAYSPDAVAKLAKQAGVDLGGVAGKVANDSRLDLQQETLKGMLTASGLTLDKKSTVNSATAMLGDPKVDALGKAIATISKEILAGNQTFEKALLENPEKALSKFWKDITPNDRKLLGDRAYLKEMVADLKQGVANTESIKDELKDDVQQNGVKDFFKLLFSQDPVGQKLRAVMTDVKGFKLLNNDKLKNELQKAGVWDRLPAGMQKYLAEDSLLGTDNRLRMAAILKSAAFQNLMKKPDVVAKFIDNVTVFNSLEFFDKLEGKKRTGGSDTVKSILGFFTGSSSFKNDAFVKEAEGVLNQISAGNFGKGHGNGALPI